MDAVRHTLPDPRQYHPQVALTNMLIHNAQSALNAKTESDREMWFSAVRDAMAEMLARGELLSISVALAMVPSQQCYQLVWDALRDAVENTGGGRAIVFAMPLVLVAGSKSQTTLPGEIADEAGLNQLLREHGVFAGDADVALGGALLHPDSVVGLDSAQLYKLNRDPAHARALLPQQPAPVTVKEEGVFPALPIGRGDSAGGRGTAVAPGRRGGQLGHAADEIPGRAVEGRRRDAVPHRSSADACDAGDGGGQLRPFRGGDAGIRQQSDPPLA
ncbi:hypothetical protein JOS77_04700 [Chromobacterium haemolyticum]|nr:hypothetical protein JOS77_04700 [Chromobacterium haemolyticum]